ncbi:MAG: cell wall-binding repeat-containing protein [Motilibacteraceae bacterium]
MNRPTTRPRRTVAAVGAVVALVAATILSSVAFVLPASAVTYVPSATDVVGPDVSSYQHPKSTAYPNGAPIDWAAVKAAGNAFAFVKATEGSTYTNPYFVDDWASVGAQGMYRGAYHFANPAKDAATQAQYFAAAVGPLTGPKDLPPVLDLEDNGGLSPAALLSWVKAYLGAVQQLTGRVPVIYTYPTFWANQMGGTTDLAQYPLWIANYGVTSPQSLGGWGQAYTFWQYTSSATVPGISGRVDMSKFNGSLTDLAALAAARGASAQNPKVTTGPLTVVGTGTGEITATQLSTTQAYGASAPEVSGTSAGGLFKVSVTPGAFPAVTLRFHAVPSTSVWWWDGSAWTKVTGTKRDPSTGDLVSSLTASTTPTPDQLQNAVIAAGAVPVGRLAGPDRVRTSIAASVAQFPTADSAGTVVLARSDVFADALAGGPLAASQGGPILLTQPTGLDAAVVTELNRVLSKGSTVFLLGGKGALSSAVEKAVVAAGYLPKRISGIDRYATAVAIANALRNPSTIFEATGLDFPDALAAGPAAAMTGAAVLLTQGRTQASVTRQYLAAHPSTARYAIGGPASAADPGATALSGTDRFTTAAIVAGKFFPTPQRVGVATGYNFADAMVAAPGLGADRAPLLLTGPDTLTGVSASYLTGHTGSINKLTIFGGSGVVSDAVVPQLQQATP